MTRTIRAEIEIGEPKRCPVARASETTASSIDDVTRSSVQDDGTVVEEFTVPTAPAPDGDDSAGPRSLPDSEPIFDCESRTVYRFTRDAESTCVCESIERFGWPVSDVRAADGSLLVTCYLSDSVQFGTLISDLRARFDGIVVRELTRSGGEAGADPRIVDRDWLTDRQREVLETAHEMGYFAYPKEANAGEVAEALDISRSTFTEHLAAAQRKVFDPVLSGSIE